MRAGCRSLLGLTLTVLLASLGGCRGEADSSGKSAAASVSASSGAARLATTYEDKEGRFAIAMPGKPKLEQAPSTLAAGPMHMASVVAADAIYYAMWFDMPQGVPVNVAGAFDGAQNNICKQDKVAVDSAREFTFDGGFPARDAVATSRSAESWKDMM